jgi:hypothetical protein
MTALVLGTALLLVLLRAGRLAAAGVERARLSGASIVGASHPAGPAEPRRPARRRGGAGVLGLGAPVVVALALVSTLAAVRLPFGRGDRFDPRDLRTVPLDVDHTLNPLVGLKSQIRAHQPDPLFTLRAEGMPEASTGCGSRRWTPTTTPSGPRPPSTGWRARTCRPIRTSSAGRGPR